MSQPLVRLEDLCIDLSRGGTHHPVLRGLDLTIEAGEILGIVGESGSGKSVLSLALMGLLPRSSQPKIRGRLEVDGVDLVHASPEELRSLRHRRLGMIFQDPMTSLNPTMRIGAQVTESSGDPEESARLLAAVGIREPKLRMRSFPHELSGGMRQRVMAAIAVGARPALILADEPTTALDVTVQAQLLDLLKELRTRFNCAIAFVTHDLAVAAQISDRIAVLYAGRIAELGPTKKVLSDPDHPYTTGLLNSRLSLDTPRHQRLEVLASETATAQAKLTGCAYASRCPLVLDRCRQEAPPRTAVGHSDHSVACWRPTSEVRQWRTETAAKPRTILAELPPPHGLAVHLNQVEKHFVVKTNRGSRDLRVLKSIDLSVREGEALSIVGESGSGKSTLLRVIAGLTPASSGGVWLADKGAQMVFQDSGSSLTPWMTVHELLSERLRPLGVRRAEAQKRVAAALEAIGLPAAVAQARPAELSGGQRQRVALARATMVPPAVLLCDEPTSALDASLAATVLNLIREMRQSLGMTVLFVTHDLAVARLMGDRIAVMSQGEIVELGETDDVLNRPSHPYTHTLLNAMPRIEVSA